MRVFGSPAFWVISAALCLATFANLSSENQANSNAILAGERPSLAQMAKEESVLREGSLLTDVKAKFRKQGDRFVFVEEGSNKSFKCLENLCLQRIEANQQEDDRKVLWLVSAKITEYKGENYVTLEKAVRSR